MTTELEKQTAMLNNIARTATQGDWEMNSPSPHAMTGATVTVGKGLTYQTIATGMSAKNAALVSCVHRAVHIANEWMRIAKELQEFKVVKPMDALPGNIIEGEKDG